MERLANQVNKTDATVRRKVTLQMNSSTERYELGEIVLPLKTKWEAKSRNSLTQ